MLPPSKASHCNHPFARFGVASTKVCSAQLKKHAKHALDLDMVEEMEQEHIQKHLSNLLSISLFQKSSQWHLFSISLRSATESPIPSSLYPPFWELGSFSILLSVPTILESKNFINLFGEFVEGNCSLDSPEMDILS
jgi:hypothetical protein